MTLILPPFTVGDTATLYAPAQYVCTVTDPDGLMAEIRTPTKRVDIPLTKAGTWVYAWPDGTTGELIVSDGPAPTGLVGA